MEKLYYLVRIKVIRHKNENGEIDFFQSEEKFEDENLIEARNQAFNHYQNYIDIFLEARNKKYESDKQAREDLKSFIDTGTVTRSKFMGIDFEVEDSYDNGIGVFLIDNIQKEEIFIHGMGNFSYNNLNYLIIGLEEEYRIYEKNNYNTQSKEIEVVFCNSDEWSEGHLGNGEWKESYGEPNTHKILKTPFDWTGYDKPYWWGEWGNPDYEEKNILKTIEELISGGENNQVEFKPSLLYNFSTGRGGIGVKAIIVKTICAFLNANGGYLFIGLNDKGEPQGLSYDFSLSEGKNEKDFFRLEFDQMVQHFLTFSVKNNISGKFIQYKDHEIFVVTVYPSLRRPIFLKGQNGKEFYIRGQASSRQINDIEELVNYCIDKWGKV